MISVTLGQLLCCACPVLGNLNTTIQLVFSIYGQTKRERKFSSTWVVFWCDDFFPSWKYVHSLSFYVHTSDSEKLIKSAWHDPQHHPPPQLFSNPLGFWYQKFCHIFLTFVVKFGVNSPNTLGEINRNVAWKLENVVTTLNKTINNIRMIFSYYF